MAPSAGNTANLPIFNGDLNGRLTSGSRYRNRIKDTLTMKKITNIMKFDIFATMTISPTNMNNIEITAIVKIATHGVCLFGWIRENTCGSEPDSAMP